MDGWHGKEVSEILERLATDPARGLSEDEAGRRLAERGPNELQAARRISPWAILLGQLRNVLVLVLLAAAGLSAFLGDALEAAVIAVIVLLAVLLGFLQEFRAERAIEALRRMAAPTATVMRGGEPACLCRCRPCRSSTSTWRPMGSPRWRWPSIRRRTT